MTTKVDFKLEVLVEMKHTLNVEAVGQNRCWTFDSVCKRTLGLLEQQFAPQSLDDCCFEPGI